MSEGTIVIQVLESNRIKWDTGFIAVEHPQKCLGNGFWRSVNFTGSDGRLTSHPSQILFSIDEYSGDSIHDGKGATY